MVVEKAEVNDDKVELEEKDLSPEGKEYDKAWEEAEKAEGKPEEKKVVIEDEDDDEKPADEKKAVPPAEEKKAEDNQEVEPDITKTGKELGLKGEAAALHDTKAFATKLAMELSNLKKTLAEKDSAEKTARVKEATEAAERAVRDRKISLQEAIAEYPELKAPLEALQADLDATRKQLDELKGAEEKKVQDTEKHAASRKYFEDTIKPEVIKVHSDFDSIVSSPGKEIFKWAEKQSSIIQYAVFNSTDPRDINLALSQFKADKSSGYVKDEKAKDEKLKDTKLQNAQALRGGSNIPTNIGENGKPVKDRNDYDGGFAEAEELLKKDGIS